MNATIKDLKDEGVLNPIIFQLTLELCIIQKTDGSWKIRVEIQLTLDQCRGLGCQTHHSCTVKTLHRT